LEEALAEIIREQQRAEEEEASKAILHRVTRALKEAFLLLPQEDYGWLNVHNRNKTNKPDGAPGPGPGTPGTGEGEGPGDLTPDGRPIDGEDTALAAHLAGDGTGRENQKEFFDFAGPLFSFTVSPASAVAGVGEKRKFRGIARDKSKRLIDSGVRFEWSIVEGAGSLDSADTEYVEFAAPSEPGLTIIEGRAYQGENYKSAQAAVTVTAELIPKKDKETGGLRKGLPGYTYRSAPGELWRSRYDIDKSLIIINNAHPDFIYASRHGITKLRYIARLFAKELVLANFPEARKEELLERMVELTLYVEENLK
jgi:hypothetical protein